MAMVYVALGDTSRGLAMLEQAESDTAFTLAWLPSFPMYDGIRSTPLYRRLVKRVGVVPR